jgi:TonB-linked SusC/RagA family outer membrane protein
MKKMLLLLLLSFGLLQGYSQGKLIKGRVTDENNKPLAGATVTLKGTTINALTDEGGNFQINTGDQVSPVLVVTFVGYTNEDFNIKGRTGFTIRMQQDIHALGDVVVVGYGVQRKRDVTGSTATVTAAEIAKRPLVRVEQALQGTVAGVAVESNSGQPGRGLSVRIRGTNSITGGNDPLYVIDGFIGGNIETLSMADIESLEILKDASATAIYGSRGSNGVVLITTKSGKAGKARIDFDPWFSKAEIPKELSLMNAYQFAIATNAYNVSLGQTPSFSAAQVSAFQAKPVVTDWQKAVAQKPWIQNYQLSVSGGSDAVQYLFSFDHLDQPGLLLNTWYKKTTLRANVDIKVNDRLNLKFNLVTLMPQSRNNNYAGDITDPFAQSYQWDPTSPVRDTAGNFIFKSNYASNQLNPVAQLTNGLDDFSSTTVVGTGMATYRILDGLTFTTNNTYQVASSYEQIVQGPQTEAGFNNSDFAQVNSSKSHSWQNSNYFTYHNRFGDHSLTLTALYEQQVGENTNSSAYGGHLSTYSLGYYGISLGSSQTVNAGYSADALQSYMGRVNYSYKDRYLLTASVRSDGSSHLISKYATFPSVALGWNMDKEKFLEGSSWISGLKLRAGYGVAGNQAVGAYSSIAQVLNGPQGPYGPNSYFYDGPNGGGQVKTPLGTPAPKSLKWEDDATTDVGIDAAFLHGRITFTAEAYYKKISNLLYSKPVKRWDGGGTYAANVGDLENKGIDLALGGTPIAEGKFRWSTNFTISFNRNKLLNLGGLDSIVEGNVGSAQGGNAIIVVGQPLGNFYGLVSEGTWKSNEAAQAALYGMKPGDAKFADLDGDHKYTSADQKVIGNGTPKYSFGWINDFSYGDWNLSMMFQGTHGNQIYSGTIPYTYGNLGDARNATNAGILNIWTPAHETDIPTFDPSNYVTIHSSRWVYDASYIKLKNLSISYRLPQRIVTKAGIHGIELYVSGQNIFTITSYPGYDPEVSNADFGAHPAVAQGMETGVVPNPRTYTFGLRASL